MSEIDSLRNDQEMPYVELKLTDSAVLQAQRLLAQNKNGAQGLRVSIADGGCSGFSYKLDFEKAEKPGDIVLQFSGLSVFVDPQSAAYLKGTVIDFSSGLYGGGFKFTNPNATGTCGCGTSFSA